MTYNYDMGFAFSIYTILNSYDYAYKPIVASNI